ncbi:MAG: bifunctional DNA-formamidopyrimidine glycosylase/DNA-(apurinic or apyrimidinic site) lyase [Phycisphaerales bacterium]
MPELPEIEHLRRSLEPGLLGARFADLRIHRADVFRNLRSEAWSSRSPRLRRSALLGLRVESLRRHGKRLVIVTEGEGPTLIVHLGMSGQLTLLPPGARPERRDHVHVMWRVDTKGCDDPARRMRLLFRDPRRFGGLFAYPSFETARDTDLNRLGPDALSISSSELADALTKTRRAIKTALLDQFIIAGVGNIYADEALYTARVSPLRPACSLSRDEVDRILVRLRERLLASIEAGGTSFSDYRDGAGRRGDFQRRLEVYGRAGEPCYRCGERLASFTLAQRTTVFCPNCQPRPNGLIHTQPTDGVRAIGVHSARPDRPVARRRTDKKS